MRKQVQIISSILILAATVAWIALSYMPAAAAALPQFGFAWLGSGRALTILAIGSFALFIALQVLLVQSTAASLRAYQAQNAATRKTAFTFDITLEAVLTALPILMMAALSVASFA